MCNILKITRSIGGGRVGSFLCRVGPCGLVKGVSGWVGDEAR